MTNNSCRYHKPRWVFTDIRDTGWQGENVHTEERLYHRQNGEEETRRNEEKITNRWWMWIWFYSLTFLNYAMMHVFLSYFENLRVWILAIEFQLNLKLYITYFTMVRLLANSNWKMHDVLWQQGQQFYYNGATVIYITAWVSRVFISRSLRLAIIYFLL